MKASDFGRFGGSLTADVLEFNPDAIPKRGSLTADVLEFNPDAIPKPDTLYVRMTRGERRIADELRMEFGGFKRVVIDVDGEQHEFSADSLVQMLEDYEDAQGMSNYMRLFGTPGRAARTLSTTAKCFEPVTACRDCVYKSYCDTQCDYDALLEWLRGDAE